MMKFFSLIISHLCLAVLMTSCVGSRPGGVLISPIKGIWKPQWSEADLSRNIVVRKLRVTPETSHHIIRIINTEKPHVHKYHDLTVFIFKGRAIIHLNKKNFIAKAGDIIEIPRGTIHWAENLDRHGSQVYAIFNPPYDGKDHHLVYVSHGNSGTDE